jgi:TolB-like protein/Tfp pilus assembly protein PilF
MNKQSNIMKYRFLNFELDTERFDLSRNGKKVDIQPRPLAILSMLVQNGDHLVLKQDIFSTVWQGRSISEGALSSQIKALRQILGDDGQKQEVIQTVYGRGFRFTARIETILSVPAAIVAENSAKNPTSPNGRTGKAPVIAVLPFGKIGKMAEHAVLSQALPADITTALSQLRWLFVIARASSFRFDADLPDLAQLRKELGVDYVLTGWVELIDNHMLVGVELIETEQHRVIWADRYDAPLIGIHEVREKMVRDIIRAIDIAINDTQAARAKLNTPDQLTAWEAYHLGMSAVNGARWDLGAALDHFELARAKAPAFSRAHAGAAYIHGLGVFHLAKGGNEKAAIQNMQILGEQALICDQLDPFAHLVKGRAERLSGNIESALEHYAEAISFCPNYAEAYNSLAVSLMLKGDFAAASGAADLAIKLSPKCPMRFEAESTQAFVALSLGNNEKALSLARKLSRLPHNSPLPLLIAMTIFHHLGLEEDARRIHARILTTGVEMRTNVLRTFPESASELSARITSVVSRYFD